MISTEISSQINDYIFGMTLTLIICRNFSMYILAMDTYFQPESVALDFIYDENPLCRYARMVLDT